MDGGVGRVGLGKAGTLVDGVREAGQGLGWGGARASVPGG